MCFHAFLPDRYAQRQQERRIKRGDRVAILGRGIAVVEQVNDRWIQATLWDKSTLRIARRDVVWDDQNMRWETSPHGAPSRTEKLNTLDTSHESRDIRD